MEKERERNTDVQEKHPWVASPTPPARDLAHDPGRCPDGEQNPRPFTGRRPPTEPRQSGQVLLSWGRQSGLEKFPLVTPPPPP